MHMVFIPIVRSLTYHIFFQLKTCHAVTALLLSNLSIFPSDIPFYSGLFLLHLLEKWEAKFLYSALCAILLSACCSHPFPPWAKLSAQNSIQTP